MRRFAVLVVTRNRPALLKRAISTFVAAARPTGIEITSITVADESENSGKTLAIVAALRTAFRSQEIRFIRGLSRPGALEGPGVTRAHGLADVVNNDLKHEGLFMFDDDMCFVDCHYQGALVTSAGSLIIAEAASIGDRQRVIVGCRYNGRQDLSGLEHLSNQTSFCDPDEIKASIARHQTPNEAPGGISGGFLFVSAPANQLWSFLPWYNEDYFWLRRAASSGWDLRQSKHALAHAPEDGFSLSYERLLFENYGEVLWAACSKLTPSSSIEEVRLHAVKELNKRIEECVAVASRLSKNEKIRTKFIEPIERARNELVSLVQATTSNESELFVKHLCEAVIYCGQRA
jgi:hypothetical protein